MMSTMTANKKENEKKNLKQYNKLAADKLCWTGTNTG